MTAIQTRPTRRSVLTPTARLRRTLRRGWAAFAALLLVITGGAAAFAYWQAASTARDGLVVADTLQLGSTPLVRARQASLAVAWTSSTTAGGRAASGYTVRRYSAATGGTPVPATGGCAGVVTTGSCTESAVPDGTWYYTVTPLLGKWSGAESTRSGAAIADATPPTVSASLSPTPNGAGYNNATPVVVTLAAQDNAGGSGIASVTYALDAGQPVTATGASASVSVAGDGAHRLTYSAADVAGNTSLSQSLTIRIDTQAPGTPSLVVPTYINAASAGGNVSVSGTAEAGSTVTISASDGAGHSMTPATAIAQSNSSWAATNLNLSGLTDGSVTFTASAQDLAGNVSAKASATSTKDTAAPTGTTITAPSTVTSANISSATVSGTAEAGASISLGVSDAGPAHTLTGTATANSAGSWSVTGLNWASLGDGQLTYTATATDRAGNTGTPVTAIGTKKATITTPAFTNPPVSIGNSYSSPFTTSLQGTAETGASVIVTATDGTRTTTATATGSGSWSASPSLVGLASGTITFKATATDAYGNTASASANTHLGPKVVSVALDPQPGSSTPNATADAGDTVVIKFDGPMSPSSFCSSWTGVTGPWVLTSGGLAVNIAANSAVAGDTLTLASTGCTTANFGTVYLGAHYTPSGTLQFKGSGVSASSVQLGADKKTLTITLGAYKAGTQSTSVTSGSPAYQAQSATDTFPVQLPSQPFTDSSSSGF
ncbi:hypothetical protein J2W20_001095 [Sinomonas atrocyanea]|uniref:Ig-like domain-containing protein n=1 Tax=Sinomonas atrocyanea TaxID=37927 RepID=UPI00278152A1|nr:Ig-like domain-containing protein [Sinomonas atrocyanea]MDQ0259207.1 hypothetical protein [Sinomonas atrocyanea]